MNDERDREPAQREKRKQRRACRQIETTLENIAWAERRRPQCTSAGACHSGIETSATPKDLSSSTADWDASLSGADFGRHRGAVGARHHISVGDPAPPFSPPSDVSANANTRQCTGLPPT